LLDFADQLLDAGDVAAADRPLRDDSKPTLHLVKPGGVGGGVVDRETGPLGQPGADFGVLMRGVVVDDPVVT